MATRAIQRTPTGNNAAVKKFSKENTIKFDAQGFVTKQVGKLLEEYAIGDMLGSGGFGEVYLGKHKKTGTERAIKVVNKSEVDESINAAVLHEFNVVRKLDHPNILKMYNLYQDESYFYIVTDIYKGGELFDEIMKRTKFTEKDAAELINQLLSCVNYCHKQGLVHRDLKPENILLEENMEMDDMKVIDFGLAAPFGVDKLRESVGTIYYMAPEVLYKSYDAKVDIWSCGVITYILLSGTPPFDGETDPDIEKAIRKGEFSFRGRVWDEVSDDALDFIQQLLTYAPDDRPTAAEALQHPWLQNSRKEVKGAFKKRASDTTRSFLNNLQNFNSTSKLKQATCAFIASQLLLKQEKEDIDDVFRALDTNCDGKLTKDEVMNGYFDFYGKKLTDDEVDKMFENINHAGTGSISYSEFVIAAMFEKNLLDNSKLQAAFDMFDSDGDGVITLANFKQVLNSCKDEADVDEDAENIDDYILEKIIKQADSDGDGNITFADFQKMMVETVAESVVADLPPPEPLSTPLPAKKVKGHTRHRSAILDLGESAESYMSMFQEAVVAEPEDSKRHRRNLSHLSLFANPESLPEDAIKPTHKKAAFSMSMLSHLSE